MTKAADTFLKLCAESDQLPDVFEFLANQEGLADRAQLDVLLVDQFQRWKHNQTIPVDHYLERTPDLDDVLKVELLIEEYGYLDQRGVAPSPESFAKRFRTLSAQARRELYDALEIGSLSDSDTGSDESGAGNTSTGENEQIQSFEFIGRYKVVRSIGQGEFGKVYLAKDPDLDRSVAIKVPTKKRINLGGGTEEFLNEARAVAKLDHPNIVAVYDCGVTGDGRCFVVSKYIRGKELRQEIRKGIHHDEAAFIVGTLARALHVAHAAGIVHRDVKPGNIIIDPKRRPHLLDFGLAKLEQDVFDGNSLIGTPAYMSPEQAEGKSHRIDGRSDIYSLGVVFYEMLTGHRPCKSDSVSEMIEQIKLGEVRPPRQSNDTIPFELERICLKALSRKLSDRYNTAKDMADEIELYLLESGAEVNGADLSSNSHGSMGSHSARTNGRRAAVQPGKRPWLALLSSPVTITGAVIALGLWAIISITNPPWKVPGSNGSDHSNALASWGDGEATNSGSLPASDPDTSTTTTNRLAVLGFRNVNNDPENAWLSTGLTELLTAELQKSSDLQVVSTEIVSHLKADLDLNDAESLGESVLNRIRDRIGPKWVVLGSYSPGGSNLDQIRFGVSVQDSLTNAVVCEFSHSVAADQWQTLIELTGAQLRKRLGLAAPDLTQVVTINTRAPSNSKAVKHYYEGLRALRRFDPATAKVLFEKAAAEDSDSALVQDGLAETMSQLGDDLSARKFSAKAVELVGDLDKQQMLSIKARNHLLEGRPADAAAAYRAILDFKQDSVEATLNLASAMITAGQGRSALELLQHARTSSLHDSELVNLDLMSAEACQSVSEFDHQLNFAQQAVEKAKEIGARLSQGHAELLAGEAQRRVGEHEAAIKCFDTAFKLLTTHGDRANATRAVGAWGKTLIDIGEFDLAETKINEAHGLSQTLENKRLIARHVGQLGELAIYRGKFDEATKQLGEALEQFVSLGDYQGTADMNLTLANLLARQGKSDEAIKMIGDARKAFQASGDRRGEARTWGQQGGIHGRKGEVPEAQRHFQRALELFREVGDRSGEATCLGDLANTYSSQGELQKAGELYSEALELHRRMASKRGPALVMFNLSVLYLRIGRVSDARNLMPQALDAFEQQGNQLNAIFVQRKLGELQQLTAELPAAKTTLDAALERSREVGSTAVEAQALASLGSLAEIEGRLDDAIKFHQESKAIRAKLKQAFNVAANEFFIARLEMKQERFQEALKTLNGVIRELSIGKPDWEPMLLGISSQILSKLGDQKEATKTLALAIETLAKIESQDVSMSLTSKFEIARAHREVEQIDIALSKINEVIGLAKKQGSVLTQFEARVEQAEMQAAAGEVLDREDLASLHTALKHSGLSELATRIDILQNR